jgi:hypothetical protein
MMNLLRMDLKRAFKNKRFWLVGLLAVISYIYGSVHVIQYQSEYGMGAVNIWQAILVQGKYGFFAALMAALPYADALAGEKNTHFITQILTRSNYRHYILSKVWVNMLAGAAAVTIPAAILLAICAIQSPGQPVVLPNLTLSLAELLQSAIVPPGQIVALTPTAYTIICFLMLATFGACYAVMGLGLSFFIQNSYLVIGLPFVVYCFGYYILPTSVRLQWLGSTSSTIIPSGNLLAAVTQYLGVGIFFLGSLWVFGKKENQVLD